jgi:hypothetical protein
MTRKKTVSIIAASFVLLTACAGQGFAQKARKAVGTAETNGTFRDYFEGNSKGGFNEIKIRAAGKGKLKVGFNLIYPNINGGNSGIALGEATIAGDTATFAPADFEKCRITIKFVKPGRIEVKQHANDHECGFGFNVSATGTYKKVRGAKPKFKLTER